MKNNIHTILCWLSLISLLISIATFCIFGVRIEPFRFTNDAVIGTMATLIGICATFMVGWQIFSSIQVRGELKDAQDLIKKLEGKISKVNSTIETQDKKLEKEKIEREKQNELFDARMQQTKGYAFGYIQILSAYYYFVQALTIFLKYNATDDYQLVLCDLNTSIDNMKELLDKSDKALLNGQEVDKDLERKINYLNTTVILLDDPIQSPIEILKKQPNYITIKEEIEKAENERKDIIRRAKELDKRTKQTTKS